MGTVAGGVLGLTAAPAHASVAQTYSCALWTSVSLFGGPYGTEGCGTQTSTYATANTAAPSVPLPQAGGNVIAADIDGAKLTYGPANIISSSYDPLDNTTNTGRLDVQVTGDSTSVYATAKAETVGPTPFWTRSPGSAPPYAEPAKTGSTWDGTAGYVQSTCSGSSNGTETGTATIMNGYVDTSTDANGNPSRTIAAPTGVNQRVNYTIDNIGDTGYIIFNEQIPNADGTLTVNAAHMYMTGPTAFGEAIFAQTICGIS